MMMNEDGFTLTELMVAIIMGSLVVSFSYSLLTFADRMVVSWRRTADIRTLADRKVRQAACDIERSKSCIELTDSTLVVRQGLEKTVRYLFRPEMVYRNGDPLAPDSLTKIAMSVQCLEKQYRIVVHITEGRMEYTGEGTARMLENGKSNFNISRQ